MPSAPIQSQQRPDTEAQRHIYEQMSKRLGDLPLVIRTFDLGGDKLTGKDVAFDANVFWPGLVY